MYDKISNVLVQDRPIILSLKNVDKKTEVKYYRTNEIGRNNLEKF